MGRLFWKFFFFIWLAQLTTVAGVSATFWFRNHELNNHKTNIDWSPLAGALVESAASTLHDAGSDALRSLLATKTYAAVYAVDEQNKEILGRPVAPALLEHARQMLIHDDYLHAVREVKVSDGQVYLLFAPLMEYWKDRGSPHDGRPFPDGRFPHGPEPHLPIAPIVAGIFASLGFAALLAWYFSKPIRNLRSAFESVSEGNLEVHLGTVMGKRRDELAELGHDFDRMVSRLRALMDGQRRLLHDISHELRSPLARLQAAIGLVRQQPERLDNSLDRIEREGMRMDMLVGELLTLFKLEAGEIGSMKEEVNMNELVTDIVKDARFEAEVKGIAVNFSGNCDAIVRGNIELLHWAIENVIRNAVKHTPGGTQVMVESHLDAKKAQLRLLVLDEGPGVPDAELNAIFEPFFRSSTTKAADGHGLGLAIARRVVETHGGTIQASIRIDGGLCVEIVLPIRGEAPAAA